MDGQLSFATLDAVRIVMDDFGTGHSSLSNLRNFPFDKTKIDRSFVHDLASKMDSRAIIQAVQLANTLGKDTTEKASKLKRRLTI
jgi:predicted signal transduction protein with EAL and GGDEF domain